MKKTLLLDLDDTLLDTDMDAFIAVYLQELASFLAPYIDPDQMVSVLLQSTQKMMADLDPGTTLREVFELEFYPRFDVDREVLVARIDDFYANVYPSLEQITRKNGYAVSFVEWALEQGYRLAIATNPLFPLAAIHHRMCWAGLPPEKYSFEVVSTYEEFHFSKPNAAYYAELAGRMGWPEGPIVVIGNDVNADLTPAQTLGFPTFWVVSENAEDNGFKPTGQGTLGDLRPWLESASLSTLEPAPPTPESLIAVLLSTPAVISWLTTQALGPELTRRPVPNEWSLTEILCHLRDTEMEVNLPRIQMLLKLNEPFIPARVTAAWAEERKYNSQDVTQALRDYIAARLQLVEMLRGFTVEWQRKARHAIFGPTDLQELAGFMVEHDKLHIRQGLATIKQIKE